MKNPTEQQLSDEQAPNTQAPSEQEHSKRTIGAEISATKVTESHELFRRLVQSVRDYAIFMLDPSGHISTWNEGAQRIKGYSAQEIIGKHFSTFYPEAEVRSGKCEYELRVAALEGRFEEEGFRVRKDGSRFWANVVISAMVNEQDQLIGFSKVTRDLTERKRMQEEQAARLAAEEASKAKDEFLAILSHELRNPLAPIVTALELMKFRGDHQTSKEQQIIERQVKHMMRLVDDLLDASRIARGKITLKRERCDLKEVVTNALEVASPLLEERNHHMNVTLPAPEVWVYVDEARLTQALANLLVNAAKYTDPGGHIDLHLQVDDSHALVIVQDNGIGIDAARLPRIFDMFIQGHPRDQAGGLGIGLSLVRSLIDMHGGTVEVSSPGQGQGSTFTVRLPLAFVSADAVPDRAERALRTFAKAARPRRLLVVDDNEDAVLLLAEIFRTVGHEVQTAGDAAEALEVLKDFKPDVAILDLGLPVMDGFTLAVQIRERLGNATPRLIALSGYGQPNDRKRSSEAGFDVHLVKPVDARGLVELVDNMDLNFKSADSEETA